MAGNHLFCALLSTSVLSFFVHLLWMLSKSSLCLHHLLIYAPPLPLYLLSETTVAVEKRRNTETLCLNRASFLQETQTVFLASKVQNNLGPSGQQNLYYIPVSPVRPALTHPHAFTLAWSNSGLSIHLKENFSVFQSADKSLSVHACTMNVDSRERLRFCPGKFMLVHVRGLKLKDKFHCKPHSHGK